MEGVIRTRVGYTGGSLRDPTYHHLGDHTEALQIDYDPERISYERLLEVFWTSHDPSRRAWSRQYMNAVYYHSPRQRQTARRLQQGWEQAHRRRVHTQILPLDVFYLAEAYHQKYILRQRRDFLRELQKIYPDPRALINSTAAARLNGYLGGHGNRGQLMREIEILGLTPKYRRKLQDLFREAKPLQ